MTKPSLPIDGLLPEVLAALRAGNALVLEAPPGAGKTTRVPPALLDEVAGEIVVLQPRRLPTRLAARRVAEELGEPVGGTVGYQVRFEDVSGPKTRIRFVTEGILGRRLLSDPMLEGVGAVILDEFHERHLAGDVALAQLRKLQPRRPELKLVVMSATLEAAPVADYLGRCARLKSAGRRFDVAIEHAQLADERPLEQQVLGALKRLPDETQGHVLVFLPGAGEIRRAHDACEAYAARHGFDIHLLHGDLSPAEQDRAVRPGGRRKLILSTNVAETSVTIDGVATVIDTGLSRQASHSPWSGLPVLKLGRISRASAVQRAGRAGRTQAGRCVRLYTRHDFDGRPEHDVPEIQRLDLAETWLALAAQGEDVARFPFFEAPPKAAAQSAATLLTQLGALESGHITELGRRLLALPLHPRLARVVAEAERRGVAEEGLLAAALLGERDIRLTSRVRFAQAAPKSGGASGPSDLLDLMERYREAERSGFSRAPGLDTGAARAVQRSYQQLSRSLRSSRRAPERDREQALLISVVAGFPDRVARRRRPREPAVLLAGGGSATIDEASVVREAPLLLAIDAEERTRGRVTVTVASQVEPEWLLDLFPNDLAETDALEWSESAERVERVRRVAYLGLALEESRQPAAPSAEASALLAQAALGRGLKAFVDPEALDAWSARLAFLSRAFPEEKAHVPDLASALGAACAGMKRFAELRQAPLLDTLAASLPAAVQGLLRTGAPERVTLPGGRAVRVHYEAQKPPWIESRLQDFFGMKEGPRVAQGRVPLVLHLLAPNQRAVQVTTDLAGFWERHYPALRKELGRKYPRHAWPEDPVHAQPPAPRR